VGGYIWVRPYRSIKIYYLYEGNLVLKVIRSCDHKGIAFAKMASYVILRERSDRRISKYEMLRFAQHDKQILSLIK
jgi:hypothetical protein